MDSLLAAALATPDDDAPRLLWAAREGGDRGELVEVQCALANPATPREARRALHARESRLLSLAHGWPEANREPEQRFERGFLVHRSVTFAVLTDETERAKLLALAPFLRSVALPDARVPDSPHAPCQGFPDVRRAVTAGFASLAPGRITAVRANPSVEVDGDPPRWNDCTPGFVAALAESESGRALRSLDLDGGHLAVSDLAPFPELESLAVATIRPDGWSDLFRSHRRLRALKLMTPPGDDIEAFLAVPGLEQLVSLDLGSGTRPQDIVALASSPRLARLEHLGLRSAEPGRQGIEALARSPHLARLRSLDLAGCRLDESMLEALSRAPFAPELRVLHLDSHLGPTALPRFLAFARLERLHGQTRSAMVKELTEAIPLVR